MFEGKISSLITLDRVKHEYINKQNMYKTRVLVCGGAGCVSTDCQAVKEALEKEIELAGMTQQVHVGVTGCMGICAVGPVILLQPDETFYVEVDPTKVKRIVSEHIVKGIPVEEYTFYDKNLEQHVPKLSDISFFKDQVKIALRNCGLMEYSSLAAYISRDGYRGLDKALKEGRQQVVDEIKKSGLRGRGGAGFPTGIKLQSGMDAQGEDKYIVCNADEGDPGAFMDRSILEGDPHSIVEGMLISAYAVGANRGYIYVRAEYPIAIERIEAAIKRAYEVNLLGKNILGSGFNFDLDIRIGAGAFVCGEETAMLASIEGKRGEPSQKPPYPFEEGLFHKPTIINNVETLGNIAPIMYYGAEWYRQYGTEGSAGTKVFALAGDVENTGIIEVPMGTILGDIVYKIGGGIKDGKQFKAVQTGGPSGGCLTGEHLSTSVDYESLAELGAIMGSGGLIVMDEETCMVDTARYFMDFICDESCGKCLPCRVGTKRMLELLEAITEGRATETDIDLLEELAETLKLSAMCGLGQTAANPVLSTLRYFRDEYENHIIDKHCTAGVCAELEFESPCRNACPANVHVSGYIYLLLQDRLVDAYQLIRQDNPFPAVCGRICTHPCELHCRRSQTDDAVAIREIKRYIGDHNLYDEFNFELEEKEPATGKRVAIVGAGPSGLTCAHYLVQLGHDVEVFEAEDVLGGILHWGIPEFRLPHEILEKEIDVIRREGVVFHKGVKIGTDKDFDELKDEFDSVYVAVGTQYPKMPGIPGEDLPGSYTGLDFLKDTALGRNLEVGQDVVVIGGGSTAMDTARTALREGAENVTVLYRRSRDQMPANNEEITDALEEGVQLITMVSPVEVLDRGGKVGGVRVAQREFSDYGRDGRQNTKISADTEYVVDCDTVIFAISQEVEQAFINGKNVVAEKLDVDRFTFEMEKGVFAGGDVSPHGENVIINAIADGKRAAISIDKFLGGEGVLNRGKWQVIPDMDLVEFTDPRQRFDVRMLSPEDRLGSYDEVNLGYHRLDATAEALRCLHCDRR